MKTHFRKISTILALVLIASLLLTGLASAEPGNRKIVVFDTGVTEAAKENIIEGAGGVINKPLPLINGYSVWLPPQAEKALLSRPGILRIDDDLVVQAIAKPSGKPGSGSDTQPDETTEWGVSRISAPSAWGVTKGAGVKVGVIDTGISTSHPDLKVWGGVNTINLRKSWNDDNGHGSHVAGIIGATDNAIGVVGVAPEAQLYAVKVLGANGSGWLSDIIEGLDWSRTQRMNVVNMSLGSSSGNQSFHDAIINAVNAGVTVVAAAGNSGPGDDTVLYPARYEEVIAVSASDQNNSITSWSSRGSQVDLIAPGSGVRSTYKGSGYATLSGTSMASPHVAGVAALRIAVDSNKSPAHIASVLKGTADPLTGLTTNEQGSGLVNASDVVTAP